MLQADHPTFFYESVHRIEKLIRELRELEFSGTVSMAREISKLFEQYFTGSLETLECKVQEGNIPLKGEFVIGIWKGTCHPQNDNIDTL
jgi:16S rRNA (cytidine1402-2'-O)-methyltransferase